MRGFAIGTWLMVAGLSAWPLACFGTYDALEASGSTSAATTTSSTPVMTTTVGDSASSSSGTTVTPDQSSSESGSSTGESFLCDELDILLMVDRRSSINNYINSLIGALLESTETLNDSLFSVRDYHIGFTTTSSVPQNESGCSEIGSLIRGENDCSDMFGAGRPYITNGDDLVGTLMCLFMDGPVSDADTPNSRPMEAMLAALSESANAPGGCNEGFFRPDAPLLILLITDQDDYLAVDPDGYGSTGEPATWALNLFLLQNQVNTRSGLAMLVGPEKAEPDCMAEPASRLFAFAEQFSDGNAVSASICGDSDELAAVLSEAFGNLLLQICGTND